MSEELEGAHLSQPFARSCDKFSFFLILTNKKLKYNMHCETTIFAALYGRPEMHEGRKNPTSSTDQQNLAYSRPRAKLPIAVTANLSSFIDQNSDSDLGQTSRNGLTCTDASRMPYSNALAIDQ